MIKPAQANKSAKVVAKLQFARQHSSGFLGSCCTFIISDVIIDISRKVAEFVDPHILQSCLQKNNDAWPLL